MPFQPLDLGNIYKSSVKPLNPLQMQQALMNKREQERLAERRGILGSELSLSDKSQGLLALGDVSTVNALLAQERNTAQFIQQTEDRDKLLAERTALQGAMQEFTLPGGDLDFPGFRKWVSLNTDDIVFYKALIDAERSAGGLDKFQDDEAQAKAADLLATLINVSAVINDRKAFNEANNLTPESGREYIDPVVSGQNFADTSLGTGVVNAENIQNEIIEALHASGGLVPKNMEWKDGTFVQKEAPWLGGEGRDVQLLNVVEAYNRKIMAGIPVTEAEKYQYELAVNQLAQEKIVGTAETGFISIPGLPLPEADAPGADVPGADVPEADALEAAVPEADAPQPVRAVEQITPGEDKGMPVNEAGRQAMVVQGLEVIESIIGALVSETPEGKDVDRLLVISMISNAPWTEGRRLRAQLEDVTQSKLRLETGAAANKEEIKSVLSRFMPSIMDSDSGMIDKLERLQRFFELTIKETNPQLFETLTARAKSETSNADEGLEARFNIELER